MADADTYQAAVLAAHTAVRMLKQYPLEELVVACKQAETTGPVLDPILYRKKVDAMREDAALLAAALRFVNTVPKEKL